MDKTAIVIFQQVIIAVASVIVATNSLTAAVKGIFNIENSKAIQIVSWVIAVGTGLVFVLCGQLDFGLTPVWNYVLGGVTGLVAGGAANKLYDWTKIRHICELIVELFGGNRKKK